MRAESDEMQDSRDRERAGRGDDGDDEELERRGHARSVRGPREEGLAVRPRGERGAVPFGASVREPRARVACALRARCVRVQGTCRRTGGPPTPPEASGYICIMVQLRKQSARRARTPATPRAAASCRRPVDGLLDPALFKALGDPTRVKLLACLMKCGRACLVGEVAECCAVDLSVVSRHLQALARAGVVESAREGRMVAYRVRYEPLAARLRDLAAAIEACAPEADGECGACRAPAARADRRKSAHAGIASNCDGGRCACR